MAAVPAVPALVAQQVAPPAVPQATGAPAAGGRGGRGGGGGRGFASDVPKISLVQPDEAAATTARYFSAPQLAALRKLAGQLLPPVKDNIGALDCDSVEFLDFLIGHSPADRQQLYKGGLNALNLTAQKQFGKPFGELTGAQADAVIKPLVVPVAWAWDPPKDPLKHFIFQAHQDIRTATRNSPEGNGGSGLFWNPIDPV